jgi:hypothetical protein
VTGPAAVYGQVAPGGQAFTAQQLSALSAQVRAEVRRPCTDASSAAGSDAELERRLREQQEEIRRLRNNMQDLLDCLEKLDDGRQRTGRGAEYFIPPAPAAEDGAAGYRPPSDEVRYVAPERVTRGFGEVEPIRGADVAAERPALRQVDVEFVVPPAGSDLDRRRVPRRSSAEVRSLPSNDRHVDEQAGVDEPRRKPTLWGRFKSWNRPRLR